MTYLKREADSLNSLFNTLQWIPVKSKFPTMQGSVSLARLLTHSLAAWPPGWIANRPRAAHLAWRLVWNAPPTDLPPTSSLASFSSDVQSSVQNSILLSSLSTSSPCCVVTHSSSDSIYPYLT